MMEISNNIREGGSTTSKASTALISSTLHQFHSQAASQENSTAPFDSSKSRRKRSERVKQRGDSNELAGKSVPVNESSSFPDNALNDTALMKAADFDQIQQVSTMDQFANFIL